MAGFRVHKTDDGRNMPHDYLPAGGLTPRLGMALRVQDGKLVAAKGAERPVYVSMTERTQPCGEGELIPVLRVGADVIWEAPTEAELSGLKAGAKLTLDGEGMSVTATTGGAAEVVGTNEAEGSVYVRFGGNCEECN